MTNPFLSFQLTFQLKTRQKHPYITGITVNTLIYVIQMAQQIHNSLQLRFVSRLCITFKNILYTNKNKCRRKWNSVEKNTELINLFQLSVTFDLETSNLIGLKGKLMMKPVHKKAAKCLLFQCYLSGTMMCRSHVIEYFLIKHYFHFLHKLFSGKQLVGSQVILLIINEIHQKTHPKSLFFVITLKQLPPFSINLSQRK